MPKTPEFFDTMNRILGLAQMRQANVNILSPHDVYVEKDVVVGEGLTLYPNVYLIGNTKIGKNCIIHAGTYIVNSTIGDNCVIGPNANIKDSTVRNDVTIGSAEITRSKIGPRTNIKHTCYVGDAKILRDCNIGAGVVFCNYDGNKKSKTEVREGAFIGSGTMIVAPLTLGAECFIAAGSVITEDVPANALVIARGQEHDHSYDEIAFTPGQRPITVVKKKRVIRDKNGWHFQKYKKRPR